MRCCDCEFRYKCDESEKVLTAFLSCERRNKFLSEKSVDNLDEIKNVTIDFGVSFDRLKELAEADKEGRCVIFPTGFEIENGIYVLCGDISKVSEGKKDYTIKSEKAYFWIKTKEMNIFVSVANMPEDMMKYYEEKIRTTNTKQTE